MGADVRAGGVWVQRQATVRQRRRYALHFTMMMTFEWRRGLALIGGLSTRRAAGVLELFAAGRRERGALTEGQGLPCSTRSCKTATLAVVMMRLCASARLRLCVSVCLRAVRASAVGCLVAVIPPLVQPA